MKDSKGYDFEKINERNARQDRLRIRRQQMVLLCAALLGCLSTAMGFVGYHLFEVVVNSL